MQCRAYRQRDVGFVLDFNPTPFESLHSSNKDNSDSNPVSLNVSIIAKAQLDLRGWVQPLCMWARWRLCCRVSFTKIHLIWFRFKLSGVWRILLPLFIMFGICRACLYTYGQQHENISRNTFELIKCTWDACEPLTCSWMPTCPLIHTQTHFRAWSLPWLCLGVVSCTYKQWRTWVEMRGHTSSCVSVVKWSHEAFWIE